MTFFKKALSLLVMLFICSAPPVQAGRSFLVKASWYGKPFHGRTMANGQTYNMFDPKLVAHKTLPKGTRVEFTNPQNGKTLIATVTDRGPYIKGRSFDLSFAGAKYLGFVRAGVTTLRVRIIQ